MLPPSSEAAIRGITSGRSGTGWKAKNFRAASDAPTASVHGSDQASTHTGAQFAQVEEGGTHSQALVNGNRAKEEISNK